MKRQKIFVLLLLCLISRIAGGQNPLKEGFDTVFGPLDKSIITTGYLYDYTIDQSSLERLDGIRDTAIYGREWFNIYDHLYSSHIVGTNSLPVLKQIEDSCFKYHQQGKNLLVILNYDYNRIKSDAFTNNLLTADTINNTLLDVVGRPSSPYEVKRVFAASPAYLSYGTGNVVFRLDQDYYFTNISSIPNVEIDFGDGLGYRTVNWNTDVLVTYNDTIPVTIKVRTIGTNQLIAKSTYEPYGISLSDRFGASGPQSLPPTNFIHEQGKWIEADIPYLGETLRGYVTVSFAKDATGNRKTQLSKPIILVEGIDFGFKGQATGLNAWDKCGLLGYWDIKNNTSYQINNEGHLFYEPFDYNLFQSGGNLIAQLNDAGYDYVYLDFEKGADYMQKNAFVLVKLIQTINSMKEGCDPIIVCGASMGGQVARYALTYMESNNLETDTRTYVSFDSPHHGADLPIGIQYFIDYYADRFGNKVDALGVFEDNRSRKLDSPGAMQLLKYHFRGQNGDHTQLRADFVNEVAAMGDFPSKMRKVALINGSGNAAGQGFSPGDELLELHLPVSSIGLSALGLIWGLPTSVVGYLVGEHVVHDYDAHVYSTMTGSTTVLSCTAPFKQWENKASHSNTHPYNSAPGGQNDAVGLSQFPMNGLFEGILVDAKVNFTGFIPSNSAAALTPFYNSDPYQNIQTLYNTLPLSQFTPFDDLYLPLNNEPHVNIHPANSSWFINEVIYSDHRLQYVPHQTYGSTYNFGNSIHRLIHNVNINSGGIVSVNASGLTEFLDTLPTTPGTHFELLSTFCASVNINNGGQFIIGDPTVGNTATVRFRSGSTLLVGPGGKLIIKDGSRVVIERGAKLIFTNGAEIQLLGDNAVLEFEGDLEISQGATFTFTYPNSTSGFVRFKPGYNEYNVKMPGGPASISFLGSGYTDKVLEVATESMYIPTICTDFDVHFGTVDLHTNARIAVLGASTNIDITNSIFTGFSHRGLHLFGQPNVNITSTFFEKGMYGIYAPLFYIGSPLNLTGVTFRECGTGLYTQGKNVNLNNVQFYDNGIGWRASLMSYPSTLEEVSAGSSSTGSNTTGILYSSGPNAPLYINNSIISNNTSEGIWVESSQLKMSCSQVNENEIRGLFMDYLSVLDISGEIGGGGGFVDLSNNSPGSTAGYDIELQKALDLFMNNGYNKLTPGGIPGVHCEDLSAGCVESIHGTLIKGYSEGCNFDCNDIHLPAYNNEWIWVNTPPRWSDEYWLMTSYQCTDLFGVPLAYREIILDADPMATYVSCEENTEPDPGNAERSIFNNCAECGTVNTEDFSDVPFAEAVIKAISAMTDTSIQNPNKTAVSYFVQILSGAYASSATQSKQNLMSYARNQMLDALGKAVQNNEIPISQNYPTISTEVQAVINLLKDVIDHTPCGPGYHERLATSMQIAQIYHLVDRRDSALAQLYATSNWATPDDAAFVSKWICGIEVEEMVLSQQIDITAFDSAMSVCPGTSNRIASNESVEENINLKEESLIISVIPNPNNGNMSIKYKIDEQQAGRIVLYDLTGKIVFQSSVNGGDGKLEINVGQLTEGVYFFRVYSGDKAVAQDKLVIIK